MNKPPEKTIEYIPEIDDELNDIIDYELCNISKSIQQIQDGYHAKSPIYNKVIIPHLKELIYKLEYIETKIITEVSKNTNKSLDELIDEYNN
jgi:hypothetical protein